jgi:2-C-methyl-D-erythritol 4-phosphate cytidylyltransferase
MELSLTNMDECPELKILVNGGTVDSFQGKSVLLDLKDGDVVELDASEVLVLPAVRISAASRNIEDLLGKKIDAAGGIVPVATVKAGN